MSCFQRKLSSVLCVLPPLTQDQFLARYSGGKRKVYERAMEMVNVRPIKASDAWMRSFTKFEKDLKESCCRLINPRSPVYNCGLGMLIAHCEKPLFRCIDSVFGGPTVLKGMDAVQMAEAIVEMTRVAGNGVPFDDWVALPSDFSRFDQHVSKAMLRFEHSIWLKMVPRESRRELARLLNMQLVNRGESRVDGKRVNFVIQGCRMSGDMNTSSGNCLLVCAMYYSLMEHLGITKYRLANNGDDCILFLERRDKDKYLRHVDQWFDDLGFTLEIEPMVDVIEHLEFCQTRPVFTARGWTMVRDPRSSMAKDLTSTCDISNRKVCERWFHAVRCGGLALTAGCPVLPHFYRMFPANSRDKGHRDVTQELKALTQSGFWWLRGSLEYAEYEVLPEHRLSFWLAFGILPDEQVALEEMYTRCTLKWEPPLKEARTDECGIIGAVCRSSSIPIE
nr:MAG: reverse transcriptase-like protein [Guiyang tombus-like virus 2]